MTPVPNGTQTQAIFEKAIADIDAAVAAHPYASAIEFGHVMGPTEKAKVEFQAAIEAGKGIILVPKGLKVEWDEANQRHHLVEVPRKPIIGERFYAAVISMGDWFRGVLS